MKLFLVFLLVFTASSISFATKGPFNPAVHKRFLDGEQARHVKVIYDVAVDSSSATAIGLGKFLPANSVIVEVAILINTRFTEALDGQKGSGTVLLQCEDSGNIFAATNLEPEPDGTLLATRTGETDITFATSAGQTIASGCEIEAIYGGATVEAGKLTAIIKYFVF